MESQRSHYSSLEEAKHTTLSVPPHIFLLPVLTRRYGYRVPRTVPLESCTVPCRRWHWVGEPRLLRTESSRRCRTSDPLSHSQPAVRLSVPFLAVRVQYLEIEVIAACTPVVIDVYSRSADRSPSNGNPIAQSCAESFRQDGSVKLCRRCNGEIGEGSFPLSSPCTVFSQAAPQVCAG